MKKVCEQCGETASKPGTTWRYCSTKCFDLSRLGKSKGPEWAAARTLTYPQAVERFWAKVEKTETCWIWKGNTLVRGGYGAVVWQGKVSRKAHRVAWAITHDGVMPPPEQKVLHSCDNPLCVNPAHLRLGSDRDNVQDTWERGRAGKPPRKRMTMEIAAEIRRLSASGRSHAQIAKQFGMHPSNISHIVKGKTWSAHIS